MYAAGRLPAGLKKLLHHYDKAILQPRKFPTPSVSQQGTEPGIMIIDVKRTDTSLDP